MKEKKSIRVRFIALSKVKQAQAIIAAALSLFLLIAIPAYAWFVHSIKVETLTQIHAPITLDIRSGHAYSIEHLDLLDIDATDVDAYGHGHKDYIFAVKVGSNISEYDIQIAHTTNIPFTYSLYRASELGDSSTNNTVPAGNVATFKYFDEDEGTSTVYYYGYASNSADTETSVNDENDSILTLTDLNPDTDSAQAYGRTIAEKFDGSDGIYSGYSKYIEANDDPQLYAVPLYSQRRGITRWNPNYDYFILRLSWSTNNDNTAFAEWNAAANNKETDMIYISAKVSVWQQ